MRISYAEHGTNDEVLQRVGQDRALLGQVKTEILRARNKAQQPRERYHVRYYTGHEATGWSKQTVARGVARNLFWVGINVN